MLDLDKIRLLPTLCALIFKIEAPREWMPSRCTPVMSSWVIIELGLQSPLGWSMMRHNISEFSFGTACTSGLYIPGSKSAPNDFEKHSATISVSTCSIKKSHSFSIFGGQYNPSHDFGYPPFIISANGQKPSCRPTMMESMNNQFGW